MALTESIEFIYNYLTLSILVYYYYIDYYIDRVSLDLTEEEEDTQNLINSFLIYCRNSEYGQVSFEFPELRQRLQDCIDRRSCDDYYVERARTIPPLELGRLLDYTISPFMKLIEAVDFDREGDRFMPCFIAAEIDVNVLKYIREKFECPWDDSVIMAAIESDNKHTLRYALENGCPRYNDGIEVCDNDEILQLLVEFS
jgi:hypothetical protein